MLGVVALEYGQEVANKLYGYHCINGSFQTCCRTTVHLNFTLYYTEWDNLTIIYYDHTITLACLSHASVFLIRPQINQLFENVALYIKISCLVFS